MLQRFYHIVRQMFSVDERALNSFATKALKKGQMRFWKSGFPSTKHINGAVSKAMVLLDSRFTHPMSCVPDSHSRKHQGSSKSL
jgi:hypothetical protein